MLAVGVGAGAVADPAGQYLLRGSVLAWAIGMIQELRLGWGVGVGMGERRGGGGRRGGEGRRTKEGADVFFVGGWNVLEGLGDVGLIGWKALFGLEVVEGPWEAHPGRGTEGEGVGGGDGGCKVG